MESSRRPVNASRLSQVGEIEEPEVGLGPSRMFDNCHALLGASQQIGEETVRRKSRSGLGLPLRIFRWPVREAVKKLPEAAVARNSPLEKGAAPRARGLSGETRKPREERDAIRDTIR